MLGSFEENVAYLGTVFEAESIFDTIPLDLGRCKGKLIDPAYQTDEPP